MYPWTKVFGTSALALRLPSVLFGIASIILIYILAALEEDRLTALLAAGMLAFNGHHIFWSQTAKMYYMGCFLGLLSTVLLVWITRSARWQWIWQSLYLVVTLAGMATVLFFWPIFLTQMLWVFANSLFKQRPLSGLFNLQILVFILGSPLWAIAAFQSKRASYMGAASPLLDLSRFLQFGFLLEPDLFSADPWSAASASIPADGMIFFLASVALLLLVVGSRSNQSRALETTLTAGPPLVVTVLAGISALLAIILFAGFAHGKDPSRTKTILVSSIVPMVLVLVGLVLRRHWGYLQARGENLGRRLAWLSGLNLSFLLAILPVSMIVVISLFVPMFAARTVLLFTPYLVIVLSKGLVSLINRSRVWIALILIVAAFHTASVVHYKYRPHHPNDYKGLAEQWIPQIEDSDLIFVQRHWATTPIFYYLKADQYRFVGWDYAQEVHKNPDSRVWVLSFSELPNPEGMQDALSGYEQLMSLEAMRSRVELYTHP
jgi:uncharacterized membrane protein